jgi:hypothetical protein
LAYFLTLEISGQNVDNRWKPRQIREIKKTKKKSEKRLDVKNIFLSTLWKLCFKNILIKVKGKTGKRLPKLNTGINQYKHLKNLHI